MTGVCRLAIRVRGEDAETALADLLPLLAGGAEERAVGGDVEYALYGRAADLPGRAEVEARVGDVLVDVSLEPVAAGWERRWHEHLRPVTVREGARAVTVRPPWIDGDPGDLVIDPDVLFGAGTHPTTRLCLRLLLAEPAGGALCDWGAGSGVLAIAAARLGWSPVTAVERDPGALPVIRANAAANGVPVHAACLDLATESAQWVPTVCVNVPGELLLALPGALGRPPERMLVSGMLSGHADAVAAGFEPLGLVEARRIHEDGWAALLLRAAA